MEGIGEVKMAGPGDLQDILGLVCFVYMVT
jgi:hypothetical protein